MSERWTSSLLKLGAQFDAGRVSAFETLPTNNVAITAEGVFCDLSHYGVLRISGEDAGRFLQAQLTNDVLALQTEGVQLNGWCSPKGRLIAVFNLWRDGDVYFMMLPRALVPGVLQRLRMFVLRSKVTLEDFSDQCVRLGLMWDGTMTPACSKINAPPPPPGKFIAIAEGTLLRVSQSRAVLIVDPLLAEGLWRTLTNVATAQIANAWDLAMIREGIIEIQPETQDAYVPQMANFELVDGVSFKKGCYPGQEIVARTQYRGILKKRMVRVRIASTTTLISGTPVFSPTFPDQAVGSIAASAMSDAQTIEALVVAQRAAIDDNSLYVDQNCSAINHLQILSLPYVTPD